MTNDPEARAVEAKMLLDNPMLKQAFDDVRDAAIHAWEMTKADDQKAREVAWLTVKVIGRVRSELESIVANGKIAASRVQNPLR